MSNSGAAQRSALIRELNDTLRRALPLTDRRSRLVVTNGVAALGIERLNELILSVRDFADFTADNDLYGEHDFGVIELGAGRYFWKIDYFDQTLLHGSSDPADLVATVRVLTVMCADEY